MIAAKIWPYALVAAVVVCLLTGWQGYRLGVRVTDANWSAKYERTLAAAEQAKSAEVARQQAAADAAKAREKAAIAELERILQKQSDDAAKADAEAAADPDANREALSREAVSRINGVR